MIVNDGLDKSYSFAWIEKITGLKTVEIVKSLYLRRVPKHTFEVIQTTSSGCLRKGRSWASLHYRALLLEPRFEQKHGLPIANSRLVRKIVKTFARRPFSFEAMYLTHPNCGSVVQVAWKADVRGTDSFRLAKNDKDTKKALYAWKLEQN
ncbi:hypothetical protein CFP56_012099 [Quercus suber]|uniref:Uncharacterized protein n=1 Tax=Quercus suber TaxID=58331 RepID=A0AAW0KYA7_QUESU